MIPCAGCNTPSDDSLCPECLEKAKDSGGGWVGEQRDEDRTHLFERVKQLKPLLRDGKLYYLIETSNEAISNEDHYRHDFEQLVLSFITILDKEEMERYSLDIIKKNYAKP